MAENEAPDPIAVSLGRTHHVGFVVADIATSVQGFVRALNASWDGCVFDDHRHGVRVTFLATSPGGPLFELVAPLGESSPVFRFLKSLGGGLHHVCFEVDDLERELTCCKTAGSLIIRRPTAAVAFGGRRVAWILTKERLLIELLESSVLAA